MREAKDQNAMPRFELAAKLAKLIGRGAEIEPEDPRRPAYDQATAALLLASDGILALTRPSEHRMQFADDVRVHFDKMSAHLSAHIGDDRVMAPNRIATLARLRDICAEETDPHTVIDGERCAADLNQPLPLPREPLKEIQARTKPLTMQYAFSPETALTLKKDYYDYHVSIYDHVLEMSSVFHPKSRYSDDVSRHDDRRKLDEKLLADLKYDYPDLYAVGLNYNRQLVNRTSRVGSGLRRLSTPAATEPSRLWASPPEIPSHAQNSSTSLGSSPPIMRGIRRSRADYESDVGESSPRSSRRRRIDRPESSTSGGFIIHEDETSIPPRPPSLISAYSEGTVSESALPVAGRARSDLMPPSGEDRIRNRGTIHNFTIHEDAPGDSARALREISHTPQHEAPAPDSDKENIRPEAADRHFTRPREDGWGL